ncbi:cation diffusion facilitator family transporter [Cyclonatronum proteinivorum]|uniref:Cation diffusion facilitator family transporter n=1 Tax=Cyclonatronum proteinivorum TaxID=1457365 RepID=A0A345UN90_9BACT|nr:cation diffusion facilitator family transporter [Cyclonatronum proteinivorum]AXJ01942.1 cation diffusion facilitator family transporter [Cyclonatronum proteinivorum]
MISGTATKDPVKKALILSLAVSAVSLSMKIGAFFVTGSTAALSDSLESVVHFFAVAFVVYGYYLSLKPADDDHHYGHERIELLSVGAEGAIIVAAAFTIVYYAVQSMITGIVIENMGTGLIMLIGAALINLALGSYVVSVGKKHNSMIAISNGKHTLTDVWTSTGVVAALVIIHFTGWLFIDIIISLGIAAYISFEGYRLLRFSVKGIMDERNPETDAALRGVLDGELPGHITGWHHLRHRTSGRTTWVELHLVFADNISLEAAHADATRLERSLIDALKTDGVITLHLEPQTAHDTDHQILRGANKKKKLDEFA